MSERDRTRPVEVDQEVFEQIRQNSTSINEFIAEIRDRAWSFKFEVLSDDD